MAHELIPVFTGKLYQDTQLCNARDLHKALKVGARFNDWIDRRIAEYGFVEGEDWFYSNLSKTPKGSKGGRPTTNYHLTLDMAKELAMLENNDIGRMVRRYFIKAEAELRSRLVAELEAKATHAIALPGVKKRARDGLKIKDALVLHEQSRITMAHLIASSRQAERLNLWHTLKQINDAVGIPTQPLHEIDLPTSRR